MKCLSITTSQHYRYVDGNAKKYMAEVDIRSQNINKLRLRLYLAIWNRSHPCNFNKIGFLVGTAKLHDSPLKGYSAPRLVALSRIINLVGGDRMLGWAYLQRLDLLI